MNSKDPFDAAIEEEQEETQSESIEEDERGVDVRPQMKNCKTSVVGEAKNKDETEEEEEEEENMEVEITKDPTAADPVKMANKMQTILSQLTEEQMNRYECFRRSGFKVEGIKTFFKEITGGQTINENMNVVVRSIAKMFVGELVETARIVMSERKELGSVRPCHIRESYRRLKLQGKVPKRSVPRLFR